MKLLIPKTSRNRRDNACRILRSLRRNFTRPDWMEPFGKVVMLRAMVETLSYKHTSNKDLIRNYIHQA